jgi:hypothetical protein
VDLIEWADERGISVLQAIEEMREHGPVITEEHSWIDSDGKRHREERQVERKPIPETRDEQHADTAQAMTQDQELRAGFHSQAPYYQEGISPSGEDD